MPEKPNEYTVDLHVEIVEITDNKDGTSTARIKINGKDFETLIVRSVKRAQLEKKL